MIEKLLSLLFAVLATVLMSILLVGICAILGVHLAFWAALVISIVIVTLLFTY